MIITDHNIILRVARSARNVALVGISDNPERASYHIAQQLERRYLLFFINPIYKSRTIMERRVYGSLIEIGEVMHIVDVFRNPQFIEPIIKEAIDAGAGVVWLQPGSENEEIMERYKDSIDIIYNNCLGVISKMV